jgi:DNA-binding transcriptional ArsR family regulator
MNTIVSTQHLRVFVNSHGVAGARLAIGYVLINHMLSSLNSVAELHDLTVSDVVILGHVIAANLQRKLRVLPTAGTPPDRADMDVRQFQPISQSALARATGIPRETVRRHLKKLIERGLVVVAADGLRATVISGDNAFGPMVDDLLVIFARATNQLAEKGALALVEGRH